MPAAPTAEPFRNAPQPAAAWLAAIIALAPSLLPAAEHGTTLDVYEQCGRAYASGDKTDFINRVSSFIETREGTNWAWEGKLSLALFYASEPRFRKQALRLFSDMARNAGDTPFSRAAEFLAGKILEEQGDYNGAAKHYLALSKAPFITDALEKEALNKSGTRRLPTYSVTTDLANALRDRAALRLLLIEKARPGSVPEMPPSIRKIAPGRALRLVLSPERRGAGEAFFILDLSGNAARRLSFRGVMRAPAEKGLFRVEIRPLYPFDAGFHLPRVALLPGDERFSGGAASFERPYEVFSLSLWWKGARPQQFEIRPEPAPDTPGEASAPAADLLPALKPPHAAAPFGRGIRSLRLRYDRTLKRFLLLVSTPFAKVYDPTTPADIYCLESADGLRWSPPRKLPVNGFRDDMRADFIGGGDGRLVWVSSRRGPGLFDLFMADSPDLRQFRNVRFSVPEPEDLTGMPGGLEIRIGGVSLLRADGVLHLFFLAHGMGPGKRLGFRYLYNLEQRACGIYHALLGLRRPPPPRLPAVLAVTRGGLDRYLGRPGPGEKSPFISGEAGLCTLLDTRGRPSVVWISDKGTPAVSERTASGWRVRRIRLQPAGRGATPGKVRSIGAARFRGELHVAASIEGEGVVYFRGGSWDSLLREKVLFREPVLRFMVSLAASPDPGGALVAAFAPTGPFATGAAVVRLNP